MHLKENERERERDCECLIARENNEESQPTVEYSFSLSWAGAECVCGVGKFVRRMYVRRLEGEQQLCCVHETPQSANHLESTLARFNS